MKQNEIKKLSKEDLEEKLKEFQSSLKDLKMKGITKMMLLHQRGS